MRAVFGIRRERGRFCAAFEIEDEELNPRATVCAERVARVSGERFVDARDGFERDGARRSGFADEDGARRLRLRDVLSPQERAGKERERKGYEQTARAR